MFTQLYAKLINSYPEYHRYYGLYEKVRRNVYALSGKYYQENLNVNEMIYENSFETLKNNFCLDQTGILIDKKGCFNDNSLRLSVLDFYYHYNRKSFFTVSSIINNPDRFFIIDDNHYNYYKKVNGGSAFFVDNSMVSVDGVKSDGKYVFDVLEVAIHEIGHAVSLVL